MAHKKRGHGEGSVYQLADGTWRAALSIPMEQGGGRRSFRGQTRQEVQRKLAAGRRALEDGALPLGDARQTVGEYLASWLEATRPNLDEGTWARDEQYVRTHVAPYIGHMRLGALSAQHLQALYADRVEEGGLSPTTVHHIHSRMHKAFADAERLGLITRNVVERAVPPRMAETEIRPLTREQARVFLDAVVGDRLYALYALRWADVDLAMRVVRVRFQIKRVDGIWTWKPPKTKRSRRQVAIPAETAIALAAHRATQAEVRLRLGAAWSDHDLVFPSRVGTPIMARNLWRAFKGMLARAGLPTEVRFHDLRHTCATLLLAARVNPKVVSEMLGHASVAITLDIYSHVLPDMQQDAATIMGQVLYG
jgi:integrase